MALVTVLGALVGISRSASAQPPPEPEYDQAALTAVLEQPPGTVKKPESAGDPLEVPPPPPRKKGVVLETGIGVSGFAGELKTISPAASNFHLQLGYEPFRWFMIFAEGDLGFTSTRYARVSRGYAIYGFGGGIRATVGLSGRVSAYLQGDAGMMRASSDVLHTYGFYEAENLRAYFGGTVGLEWYQIDRHYALVVNGGARKTPGFAKTVGSDAALSWLAGVAIRYTF